MWVEYIDRMSIYDEKHQIAAAAALAAGSNATATATATAPDVSVTITAAAAAAAPNPALDVKQVQVRFVSRVDASETEQSAAAAAAAGAITHSTIDQMTYTVPVALARDGLSELVNTLLKQGMWWVACSFHLLHPSCLHGLVWCCAVL